MFARDKVRRIAMFQDMAFLGENKVVNFSDSASRARVYGGLTHYLHARYPEMSVPPAALHASFADDHCGRWAPALRNLIWLKPQAQGETWREVSHYAPDAQWLVSRHSSSGILFGFAAKCGHNGEPHNHNDVGHLLLHADGETFLTDLGAGRYSRAYFGEERYLFPCNGSQGHSVPMIDGCCQQAGRHRRGKVLHVKTSAHWDVLEMEMAAAYDRPALRRLVRKLTWIKTGGEEPERNITNAKNPGGVGLNNEDISAAADHSKEENADSAATRNFGAPGGPTLNIQDTFELDGQTSLIERFVCEIKPVCMPQAGLVALRGKRLSLVLAYDASCWQAVISSHAFENHQGAQITYYTLDFHALSDSLHPSAEAFPSDAKVTFELTAHFERRR